MIKLSNVSRLFKDGEKNNEVLHNINLTIENNEFITVMGPSGSGKSTLLNLIALLIKPSEGEIYFNDKKVIYSSEKEIDQLRRDNIGLIFQNANLISCLTPLENILLVMKSNEGYNQDKKIAMEWLEKVGMADKYKSNIMALSGGELQRISIVRALVNKPQILLCDEPTGALDYKNSSNVLKIIMELQKETKCSVVIVTHDEKIGLMGNRRILLEGGNVCELENDIQAI